MLWPSIKPSHIVWVWSDSDYTRNTFVTMCTVTSVKNDFKGCRLFKEYAVLHLAVIIAPGPLWSKQPTSQTCEGEALPSVCKVCFNCDLIWIGLFKYYFGEAYLCHNLICIKISMNQPESLCNWAKFNTVIIYCKSYYNVTSHYYVIA